MGLLCASNHVCHLVKEKDPRAEAAYWREACTSKNLTINTLRDENAKFLASEQSLKDKVARMEQIMESFQVKATREVAELAQVRADQWTQVWSSLPHRYHKVVFL